MQGTGTRADSNSSRATPLGKDKSGPPRDYDYDYDDIATEAAGPGFEAADERGSRSQTNRHDNDGDEEDEQDYW